MNKVYFSQILVDVLESKSNNKLHIKSMIICSLVIFNTIFKPILTVHKIFDSVLDSEESHSSGGSHGSPKDIDVTKDDAFMVGNGKTNTGLTSGDVSILGNGRPNLEPMVNFKR